MSPPLIFGLLCLWAPLTLLCVLGCGQWLYRRLRPLLAAAWYRLLRDPDVYPPEAAETPRDDLMLLGDTLGFPGGDEEIDQLNALYRLPAYIKEQHR